ncbi:hypothetical protein K443DRAFT_132169 [Laccaria amethystina LaAM-08-1]|uniref:Transmembrane protein n=1 Tax=Laccaria amethystina LaAM-08-1 TaxID=1095629 RepID=A0A0C9X9P7_9AGAR|nr:hypothetical protein K443DRAFT_132169 [Laccaria amethystina LaAM-08-1]
MESVKLYFRLIYERRNLVKIPAISIASLSLFLHSSLACFLYIISFRETARYRLSYHSWVMPSVGSWRRAELYIDHLNAIEVTDSLAEHCDHFLRFKEWDWDGVGDSQALGCCIKFDRLRRAYQGFEWANALSPKPDVGVWWEIELMAMPWVCIYLTYYASLFLILNGDESLTPESGRLLLVFGTSHAAYIMLTTKRDVEAIQKSWKRRIDGWVFERQYAIPTLKFFSESDRGLTIEVM